MLSWCLLFLFSGARCKLYDRWRVAKFRLVPSSSANLCMSFTIEENPFLHAFHTLLFTRSGFSYILIFISLYSSSTVLSSHPPLSLGRNSTALELRGCLPPFSLINFVVSLSMLWRSPNGRCWVYMGTSRQARQTVFCLDAAGIRQRACPDYWDLLQVHPCCNCKCLLVVLHDRLSHTQELVLGPSLKVLDQSRLIQFKNCCIFNLLAPGLLKVAGCWRKSPPTWIVLAGYSAWHFFTDGVF